MVDCRSLRVAVLFGGVSPEREVSLASGYCVAAALELAGYEVLAIDPAEVDLAEVDWPSLDACFIALHGGAGEDGRIQQLLETYGVPHTGSDPQASRWAMDKARAKEIWRHVGVPTPPSVLLDTHQLDKRQPNATLVRHVSGVGFPVVVKPNSQGSSVGVGLARHPKELLHCLEESRRYEPLALAEAYVAGREFTVTVLGRRALPLLEIECQSTIFSYQAKYDSAEVKYHFDCGLAKSEIHSIQRTAIAAAEALATQGLARVDLILDGNRVPQVLEVNTVPGMTTHSLAPQTAAHAGIQMHELCDMLIRDCLAKEPVP